MMKFRKIILFVIIFLPLFAASAAKADTVGQMANFYIEPNYDETGRSKLSAVLVKESARAYFYIDEQYWNFAPQGDILDQLSVPANEFDNKIYPTLINTFGSEWNPGIDKDSKITILLHPIKDDAGGYFRSNDEYPKIQITNSNEREMIYLNVKFISSPFEKSLLAHEFMHLVTFNQKNKAYDTEEDTWLNEARAEYAPNLLGYNDAYEGSYLEKRVQYFLEKPNGSLVDWQGLKYDYGRANLFITYLVDHFGLGVLTDSLKSKLTGIDSINYALERNGYKENFSQIFNNWLIATLINDCSYGKQYCYLDKSLKNFNLSPQIYFLPISGSSTLTFSDNAKYWAGNWYKIIGGGGGTLKFHFEGDTSAPFKVVYISKSQSTGKFSINFISLDKSQEGNFEIQKFGKDVSSIFVLPMLKENVAPDDNYHSFFWSASISRDENSDASEIQRLQEIIADLQEQIARILAGQKSDPVKPQICQIVSNLFWGSQGAEVSCLQQFLKIQGVSIYPSGLVTGYFGALTKAAVANFQEKYASDILTPAGLKAGTGYVGERTRQKINQMMKNI